MEVLPVVMLLDAGVVANLCKMDLKFKKFVRKDGKVAVRLKKALHGCLRSAVLWYKELSSTIISVGFVSIPYDICPYTRNRNGSIYSL